MTMSGRWPPASGRERIAVVIPAFNRQAMTERAAGDVLAQIQQHDEVVVVDDGSSPPLEIKGVLRDPSVIVVRQENSGACSARNRGVRCTNSPLITFLDSDDGVEPGWLDSLRKPFSRPDVGVVCCGVTTFVDGVAQASLLPASLGTPFFGFVGLFTQGGTYAVRRNIFDAVGGFDERMPASQHTEFALRLTGHLASSRLEIHSVMGSYVRYNQHRLGNIRSNDLAVFEAAKFLLERYGDRFAGSATSLASLLSTGGVRAIRAGHIDVGRQWLVEAARVDPRGRRFVRAGLASFPWLASRVWPPSRRR